MSIIYINVSHVNESCHNRLHFFTKAITCDSCTRCKEAMVNCSAAVSPNSYQQFSWVIFFFGPCLALLPGCNHYLIVCEYHKESIVQHKSWYSIPTFLYGFINIVQSSSALLVVLVMYLSIYTNMLVQWVYSHQTMLQFLCSSTSTRRYSL